MTSDNKAQKNDEKQKPSKKPYEKPRIDSEDLVAVAALCNGTSTGGRKATTMPPTPCDANKIKS